MAAPERPWQRTAQRYARAMPPDAARPWELDSEVMGRTRRLMIVTQPGRLLVRVLRDPAAGWAGSNS